MNQGGFQGWPRGQSLLQNRMKGAEVTSGTCAASAPMVLSPQHTPSMRVTPGVHSDLDLLSFLSPWKEHMTQTLCSQQNMSASDVCSFWVQVSR